MENTGLLLCQDLQTSVDHCGSCNNRCPSGTVCEAAVCVQEVGPQPDAGQVGGTCAPGLTLCLAPTGLFCQDLQTSLDNCGGCNNRCPFPKICQAAVCVPQVGPQPDAGQAGGTCAPGLTLCLAPTGFFQCQDLRTSFNHCGGCNFKCRFGTQCQSGVCVPIVNP